MFVQVLNSLSVLKKKQVPSASLPYHQELASQQPKTAYFLILCDQTVAFISLAPNYVLLVESHAHGLSEEFVALCDLRYVYQLLDWFKSINRFQYTLGTLTQVVFPYSVCYSFEGFRQLMQRSIVHIVQSLSSVIVMTFHPCKYFQSLIALYNASLMLSVFIEFIAK